MRAGFLPILPSTSVAGGNAPRRSRLLDERRKDPAEQDSREHEETDRDHERDAESETGEGGHGSQAVSRKP
jgi:hypothetical protein